MRDEPAELDPALQVEISTRIEVGVSFKDAAIAAGAKPSTAKGWLTRGRREDAGVYFDFAAAVDAARRKAAANARRDMTTEEFDEQLAKAIRGGSVQAMKLWWEINRQKDDPDGEPDPFDLFPAAAP